MSIFRTVLGVTPSVLLVVLLGVLLRVRAYKEFPWFFAYVTFAIGADIARFGYGNDAPIYFYVYWGTEAGYAMLGVLVLYEVFRRVFRELVRLWYVRWLFPAMLLFGVTFALLRYELFPSRIPSGLLTAIIVGEFAVRLLQVAVFCLLVLLVYLFGLRWKQYAFGIAAGFGLYATTALIATTKFYEYGAMFAFIWGSALLVSYIVAVVIWICFLGAAPVRHQSQHTRSTLSAEQMQRYKDLAQRILGR